MALGRVQIVVAKDKCVNLAREFDLNYYCSFPRRSSPIWKQFWNI